MEDSGMAMPPKRKYRLKCSGDDIMHHALLIVSGLALMSSLGAWIAFAYMQAHLRLNARLEQTENNVKVIAVRTGLAK